MRNQPKFEPTFIRAWREHRGKSLEWVAARAGVTASNMSKIERGVVAYTQPTLEAIAKALGTSPAALLAGPPETLRPAKSPPASILDGLERDDLVKMLRLLISKP